jgi:hypothetical protein
VAPGILPLLVLFEVTHHELGNTTVRRAEAWRGGPVGAVPLRKTGKIRRP